VKLLKTIRFDASDERVFELAAVAGEWAVSGAFAFVHLVPAEARGKMRQAFANGFLGLTSFGRSTFATVVTASPAFRDEAQRGLAAHLVGVYGAPDLDASMSAALEEVAFVESLCRDVAVGTILAVSRTWNRDGCIKEEFHTVNPPSEAEPYARIWTVVDDEA
jgi:uncharacterized protein DUF6505